MDFPIQDLMNEDACYQFLLDLFHPPLRCSRCHAADGFYTQRDFREPVLDYRCSRCSRVFNAWTGTRSGGVIWPSALATGPDPPRIAQGRPPPNWQFELSGSRRHLLDLVPSAASPGPGRVDRTALEDKVVEADETTNAGGGCRTKIPRIRPGGGPTKPEGTGPWITTALP